LGLAVLALAVLAAWPTRALHVGVGPDALDVRHLAGGPSLVTQTFVLEDAGGKLQLGDVLAESASFVRAQREASFGFTRSAYWIRFDAVNPGVRAETWLLELAYPHLDFIDLYTVESNGHVEHWRTGDRLPFAQREVDVPNFVWSQTTAAHSRTTYYLRLWSAGSVRAPLRAWRAMDFVVHETQQNLMLWLFYGVVFAMTCFNIGNAVLLRQREYAYYVAHLIAMGGAIFTLSGQTFQYLLPNHPDLANRSVSVCIALGMFFVQLYTREVMSHLDHLPQMAGLRKLYAYTIAVSGLVVLLSIVLPHTYSQRTVFVVLVSYVPLGIYKLIRFRRFANAHLRVYSLSLLILAVSVPISVLAHAKVIPPYALAVWAGHIGCAAYCIITSLALPMRVSELGSRLAGLNQQLSNNVVELKNALTAAERATKVKDEFMATMSHELRTPLNAIINVPQGLLDDFPVERAVVCTVCKVEFLLEPGETISGETLCATCGAQGTLTACTTTLYVGEPARTARFLRKIERSGHHLLQMVNGVLDFSKMEAGRFDLSREPLDLRVLLSEVVDQMSDYGLQRGVAIELALANSEASCQLDGLRIRQVMLNLLTNAIKFSEPGTTVFVRWQRDAAVDRIEVQDRGIGIAPENHERVFASFEQVHKGDTRRYGGSGLGLSISRSLVRMHGGELSVESALGVGSTFTFTLPREAVSSSDAPAA